MDALGAGIVGVGVFIPIVQGPVSLTSESIHLPFGYPSGYDFFTPSSGNGIGRTFLGALFALLAERLQVELYGPVRRNRQRGEHSRSLVCGTEDRVKVDPDAGLLSQAGLDFVGHHHDVVAGEN